MKIAIDLTSLADNFSGIERMALSISKELLECDKESRYQLFFKGEIHSDFVKYGTDSRIEMVVLPVRKKLWFSQMTLMLALKQSDADVFLFLAFPSPYFLRKKRIVNTIHDMGCRDCPETMKKYMALYFWILDCNSVKVSERIITISEFSKNRILHWLGKAEGKVEVLYLGVPEHMYQYTPETDRMMKRQLQLPEEYILCLSTLEPKKNMELLVEAFVELLREGKCSCSLVLAGRKGWKMDNFLLNIPETYREKIIVTGYVKDEALPYLYHRAKVFVFPSFYEGFGLPPLEAMASGCPVICSDIDVLKEILGDMPVYFRNNDKDDLKKVLKKFLDGHYVLPGRGELILWSTQYSYRKTAEKLRDDLLKTEKIGG